MATGQPQTPDRAAYEQAIRDALRGALSDYPTDAVTVTEARSGSDADVWGVEVEPRNPAAASVYVSYWGGDEVVLGFGETHTYLWDDSPDALLAEVRDILRAVFAGRVLEAGPTGDSTARLMTPQGRRLTVGAMTLPLPWRWRRARRYASLG